MSTFQLLFKRGFQRRPVQDIARSPAVPAAAADRVRHAEAPHDADLGDDVDAHHGGKIEGGRVLRRL